MLAPTMALAQPLPPGEIAASAALAPAVGLRPMLRAVVARILRMPLAHADVEDCVGETFRRIVEHRSRLRPGEPMGPWAAGIAKHVALDHVRSRRREHPSDVTDEAPDSAPSPEDATDRVRRVQALRAALAKLDPGPREALVAFHVEGASYQEIAARLGIPMGTVATWISRSRKTLEITLERRGQREDRS
jgi:RNA polymerase sigma-70 factor (ECF subfamily)